MFSASTALSVSTQNWIVARNLGSAMSPSCVTCHLYHRFNGQCDWGVRPDCSLDRLKKSSNASSRPHLEQIMVLLYVRLRAPTPLCHGSSIGGTVPHRTQVSMDEGSIRLLCLI